MSAVGDWISHHTILPSFATGPAQYGGTVPAGAMSTFAGLTGSR
ncbi:hypothetical protein [Amycolatopsis minnesotensis]